MFEPPEQTDATVADELSERSTSAPARIADAALFPGKRMPAPPPAQLPNRTSPLTASPLTGQGQEYQPDAVPAPLPGGLSPRRWGRFFGSQSHTNNAMQMRVAQSPPVSAPPHEHRLPDAVPSPLPLPANAAQLHPNQQAMVSSARSDAYPTRLSLPHRRAPRTGRWLLFTLALPLLMFVSLLVFASVHFAWLGQFSQHGQGSLSSQTPLVHATRPPTGDASPQDFTEATQGYALRYPGLWMVSGYPGDRELSENVTPPTAQYSQIAVFKIQVLSTRAHLRDGTSVSDANLLDDFMYPQVQAEGDLQTTENTITYAGSQWLRQEITVSGTDQSFREIGLLGHHHAQTYILIYYVNQGDWPPAAVHGFTLILSSFHFTF